MPPPSGEMARLMKREADTLPKGRDQAEPENDETSLERFLDDFDLQHGGDVAGGIDRTDNPRNPQDGPPTRGPNDHRFPNGPGWPPDSDTAPYPYATPSRPFNSIAPIPSPTPLPELNVCTIPGGITTICITGEDGLTTSTTIISLTDKSPDLISESSNGISYTTITADNTGTVTDTATIVVSGQATRVIFPQHDKTGPPPPPSPSRDNRRMKDILLGVFLGAGLVLLFVACLFGYRAYKRKKRNRRLGNDDTPTDSEQPQQTVPEMQVTGVAVTMPSMADAPTILTPPPPFIAEHEPAGPSEGPQIILPIGHIPQSPIIINPFSDPTYNSSSGIEDYVASNGIPLGREPENPFLHPDDRSLNMLERRRPNSAGDFPPEYTTVDGDPTDSSGHRAREERFPFGDEALSLRAESDAGSIHTRAVTETIPGYQYDDPNGVADGFRYNPSASR
ncbi:hypothetical protein TWF106_001162 [Orbilia oligospora]|uniref:Uncharacterized protein n=1 Tax=Orbilia oligospora TaxID=2813651 RepID=A0A6G1M4Q2_ORBOL|nr:hypothetical protein TWF788_005876 [Orbilia oligospora]KAF3196504.1 hypothetical protein TWF679_005081 [Orbilia oligospora]KAF3202500.1 hypothetical protein TWF191_002949 [Orbilia oligospora]KAF3205238.1 hypothetical protein TWF106_001162 [Orbilia oligospora]KAF3245092.1 hypothetical protein TWF192_007611 [Orbilia oligospora]